MSEIASLMCYVYLVPRLISSGIALIVQTRLNKALDDWRSISKEAMIAIKKSGNHPNFEGPMVSQPWVYKDQDVMLV